MLDMEESGHRSGQKRGDPEIRVFPTPLLSACCVPGSGTGQTGPVGLARQALTGWWSAGSCPAGYEEQVARSRGVISAGVLAEAAPTWEGCRVSLWGPIFCLDSLCFPFLLCIFLAQAGPISSYLSFQKEYSTVTALG